VSKPWKWFVWLFIGIIATIVVGVSYAVAAKKWTWWPYHRVQ